MISRTAVISLVPAAVPTEVAEPLPVPIVSLVPAAEPIASKPWSPTAPSALPAPATAPAAAA